MDKINVIKKRDSKGNVIVSERIVKNRDIASEMAVHIYGDIPTKLIGTRRPTESKEAYDYRLANYQPITKPLTGQALDNIYRIFSASGGNYKIDGILKEYMESIDFYGQPFDVWVSTNLLKINIADPNAWVVWFPYGEGVVNPSVRVEPYPVLVNSEYQIAIEDDYILWLSGEKSEVVVGGKSVIDGEIYYAADKDFIYKIYQIGNKSDKKYIEEIYYKHSIGYIPFIELGGIRSTNVIRSESGPKAVSYYESFFNSFVPFGNDLINAYDDWKAIMVSSCFPIKVLESIECKKCNGRGSLINDKGDSFTCSTCGGTGEVGMLSPFGTMLKKRVTALDGDVASSGSVLDYVSPDAAIIQQSMNAWKELYSSARQALHLEYVDEAQSGKAKEIDREGKYSLLSLIADNMYNNIIANSLYFVDKYLNITGESTIVIEKPVSFVIETESDILAKIKAVKESEVNPFIVNELELTYIEKTAPNNEALKLRTKLYNDIKAEQDDLVKAIMQETDGKTFDDYEEIKSKISINLKPDENGKKEEANGMGEGSEESGSTGVQGAD